MKNNFRFRSKEIKSKYRVKILDIITVVSCVVTLQHTIG